MARSLPVGVPPTNLNRARAAPPRFQAVRPQLRGSRSLLPPAPSSPSFSFRLGFDEFVEEDVDGDLELVNQGM